jgi:proline iminopeptidase
MPMRRMILVVCALLVIPATRSSAAPPREGYVPVEGGLRLHYRVLGQGKDAVIIPSDVGWGTRADGLARGRTVVLYDPRGHGRSDEIKDPSLVGMEYEVRDVEALRRHLSLDRVSLIGWSYLGGMVALYAEQYPERVDAVVQVGAMPLRKGPHFDAYLKKIQARQDPAAAEKLAQMQKDGLPERDPVAYCKAFYEAAARTMTFKADVTGIVPPGLCELANERPTRRSFSVTGRLLEGLGDWDWTAKAGAVRARVLTVHGAHDNVPVESSREWVQSLPNARLLVFDESGHLPFAEQPAEFTRAVDTFLKGAWPEGAETVR